jgi:rRNA-processing protein FCF1
VCVAVIATVMATMIAAIAEANRDVVVVTADRELPERARVANAEVVRPSWLLDQLVD